MDVEKLILVVKKRPILYDEQLPDYPNYNKRLKAWQDVAKTMNQPVEDCRKKWGALRSLYNSYLRQKAKYPNSKWQYTDELQFLDKYLRRNRQSVTGGKTNFEESSDYKNDNVDEEDSDFEYQKKLTKQKSPKKKSLSSSNRKSNKSDDNDLATKTETTRTEKIITSTSIIHQDTPMFSQKRSLNEWFTKAPVEFSDDNEDEDYDPDENNEYMLEKKWFNLDKYQDEKYDQNYFNITNQDIKIFLLLILTLIILIISVVVWPIILKKLKI